MHSNLLLIGVLVLIVEAAGAEASSSGGRVGLVLVRLMMRMVKCVVSEKLVLKS